MMSRRVLALPSLLCLTASVALCASVLGTPADITYVDAAGNQLIFVFAVGSDGQALRIRAAVMTCRHALRVRLYPDTRKPGEPGTGMLTLVARPPVAGGISAWWS